MLAIYNSNALDTAKIKVRIWSQLGAFEKQSAKKVVFASVKEVSKMLFDNQVIIPEPKKEPESKTVWNVVKDLAFIPVTILVLTLMLIGLIRKIITSKTHFFP